MEDENSKAFSSAMKGGDGPDSYAQNSSFQRVPLEAAKKYIEETINKAFDAHSTSENSICIADMGCSTGPNTIIVVQYIIEAIELHYQSKGFAIPEFHVFFNDQVGNDFNTLFKKLSPNRKYYAAGVAGSFYGRLLPKRTLHLVHSSMALQWLSKVPKEITDKNSYAFNKGRIHYTNATLEVVNAYKKQFEIDLEIFLHARAQEVVGNGLMVLQIPAARDAFLESDVYPGKVLELLGSCLLEMAKLGVVTEEKIDSFNVPVFFPPLKTVEAILQRNGDFFIERMEILDPKNSVMVFNVQMFVSHYRAIYEGLIENHFGHEIIDELFNRFTEKVVQFPDLRNPQKLATVVVCFILKRKLNG